MQIQLNRKVALKVTSAVIILSLVVSAFAAALRQTTVWGFAASYGVTVLGLLTAFALSVLANLFHSYLSDEPCPNCGT